MKMYVCKCESVDVRQCAKKSYRSKHLAAGAQAGEARGYFGAARTIAAAAAAHELGGAVSVVGVEVAAVLVQDGARPAPRARLELSAPDRARRVLPPRRRPSRQRLSGYGGRVFDNVGSEGEIGGSRPKSTQPELAVVIVNEMVVIILLSKGAAVS